MSRRLNVGFAASRWAIQAPEEPVPEPTPKHNGGRPFSSSREENVTETAPLADVPARLGSALLEPHSSPLIESFLVPEIDEGGIQVGGLSLPSPILSFVGDVTRKIGPDPDSNSSDEDSSYSFEHGFEFEPGLICSADVYSSDEGSSPSFDSAAETLAESEDVPQLAENVHLAEFEANIEDIHELILWFEDLQIGEPEENTPGLGV